MIKALILSLLLTGSLARFARMNNDDPNDGKGTILKIGIKNAQLNTVPQTLAFVIFEMKHPVLFLTDAEASKDMTTNLQDNVVLINMKMFWFVGDNPNSKNLTTILDSRELTENPSIPKGAKVL